MDSPVNLHLLQLFYNVVEYGSYSLAAEKLFMTQPALSLQIKSLEKKLGVILLERKGNKMQLTQGGELVYKYAAGLLRLDEQLRLSVQEFVSGNVGHVSINSNRPIGRYLLPNSILRFIQHYPSVEITTSIDNSDQVSRNVQEEKADIGFIAMADGQVPPDNLEKTLIYSDYWVLVCAPESPWIKLHNKSIYDMTKEAALIGSLPKTAHGKIIDEHLRRTGLNYDIKLRLDDIESIKIAVLSRVGISFLPKVTVERELANHELVEIRLNDFNREPLDYYMITKSGAYITPTQGKFIKFIRESFVEQKKGVSP